MLKVALLTDGPGEQARVSPEFAAGTYLVVADADTGKILSTLPCGQMCQEEIARRIVEEDCEAVITGPIPRKPFEIIADEGCATSYNGVGAAVPEAIEKMNSYALPLIPDYIDGKGCHPGNEVNCKDHHHD